MGSSYSFWDRLKPNYLLHQHFYLPEVHIQVKWPWSLSMVLFKHWKVRRMFGNRMLFELVPGGFSWLEYIRAIQILIGRKYLALEHAEKVRKYLLLLNELGTNRVVAGGSRGPGGQQTLQILVVQFTISQPGEADYAQPFTAYSPVFENLTTALANK